MSVLSFLVLPSFIVLAFLMEQNGSSSGVTINNWPAAPLSGLGECNAYYSDRCIRAVYTPRTEVTDAVMAKFSEMNELEMSTDVIGFNSTETAQQYVADNLGVVQYTIFFGNDSLWETQQYSPNNVALGKNLSYVIFYNETIDDNDRRSKIYDLNYPLLTLQKSIETAFLSTYFADKFEAYNVDYGQFWQQETSVINATATNTTTGCDLHHRPDAESLATVMPWVVVFSFLFMATISFQLIAEERRNKLFGFLRRLGLMDSSYWLSWFLVFEVLLVVACAIAILGMSNAAIHLHMLLLVLILFCCIFLSAVALVVRTQSSILRAVDLQLLYLILWLSGTSFLSLSCFLAALSSSASVSTSLYSAQFLAALITVAASSGAYNYYSAVGYSDGLINETVCYYVSSSYNRIYSSLLIGNQFVKFLVFFLPWFHAAQAMSDVLSIVQYDGQSVGMGDISQRVELSFTAKEDQLFTSPGLKTPLTMLITSALM